MNGYKAFFKDKSTEVQAETALQAQTKAAAFFKVSEKRRYQVAVVLCETGGVQVTHLPLF